MSYYERGEVRIYYEEHGSASGIPLLLIAPGAMFSTVNAWKRVAFDPLDYYPADFRVIAMDQRNCGRSTGPLEPDDPWGMYADDQLGLMEHLGIDKFFALGCCIGSSYILQIALKAPDRLAAGGLMQPIGIDHDDSDEFRGRFWRRWGDELSQSRPDIDKDTLEAFGTKMWGGPFTFNLGQDVVRGIQTPMLVLPGNDTAHPSVVALELTRILPNAELREDWKEPPELIPETVDYIRAFFKKHDAVPATA